jgi:hypothetical protein
MISSSIVRSSRLITQLLSVRTLATKRTPIRPISPQLRFHLDTKSVYGSLRMIRNERCKAPSEFDLINQSSAKQQHDNDTELLYSNSKGFHRACSLPKGIPISERSKYLRQLFRIPRGEPISQYPQAYVPNKYLGVRSKDKK